VIILIFHRHSREGVCPSNTG